MNEIKLATKKISMAINKSNLSSLIYIFVAALFLSSLLCVTSDNALKTDDDSSFSYDTLAVNGPAHWANLNPSWALCGTGSQQSPIDIGEAVYGPSNENLNVLYKPARATIVNTDHHIEVTWTEDAGGIFVRGSEYKLRRGHWHVSSEHAINGTIFDMEMHILHTNPRGDFVIISIMYELGLKDDLFISNLSPHLQSVNRSESDMGIIDPREIGFPSKLEYYGYTGSITTPPCSENVSWILFKTVKPVSSRQIQELKDAVGEGGKDNVRPLQPLNGRQVYFSK